MKAVQGFLGLTSYYCRFVKDYGTLGRPLTDLLKKEGFHWNKKAEEAFERLKVAMGNVPTLSLHDFVLETNASDSGVGAVLKQEEDLWFSSANHWPLSI